MTQKEPEVAMELRVELRTGGRAQVSRGRAGQQRTSREDFMEEAAAGRVDRALTLPSADCVSGSVPSRNQQPV